MRKLLFTLALFATLTATMPAMAQKHRHTPRTQELTDTTTSKAKAIEAFSDTTTTDGDSVTVNSNCNAVSFATDSLFDGDEWESDVKGMKFVIACLFILFVLAPATIIGLILWFIHMNRKSKIRLAELAAQNGQSVPTSLVSTPVHDCTDYTPGIKHCCLGIGLAIFLGIIMNEVGFGIGALVFFIGLGKLISAYIAKRKEQVTELNPETNEEPTPEADGQ